MENKVASLGLFTQKLAECDDADAAWVLEVAFRNVTERLLAYDHDDDDKLGDMSAEIFKLKDQRAQLQTEQSRMVQALAGLLGFAGRHLGGDFKSSDVPGVIKQAALVLESHGYAPVRIEGYFRWLHK